MANDVAYFIVALLVIVASVYVAAVSWAIWIDGTDED